jgi:glucosamine--fructose-6-phosphate aminotransferase (isomerizing)
MSTGSQMVAEMAEQPRVLGALLSRAEAIAEQMRALLPADCVGATIVARGSSDHASTYGRYLLEGALRRPVGMAAPSLGALYGIDVDARGYLAIAASQSGRTPEIVAASKRLRADGARTLAITNDAGSDLAAAAGGLIALEAGPELAVPATKTVTAQMLAYALLARGIGEVPFLDAQLAELPGLVDQVLADPEPARVAAAALADATRLVVTARGLLYGAALEAALKLQETTSIAAVALSSADLRHGPIAIVGPGFPVLALLAPGPAYADMLDLVATLRARGALVLTIAPDADADLPLPPVPEPLAPLLAVVRAQQLARELALLRARDPDAPDGLNKVTLT